MKIDDRQIQDENFSKLKKMVEQFEAKSSTIQKSMKRIESICEWHIIKRIDWNAVFDRVKDAINTGEISKLETAIIALTDFCKSHTE